MTIRKEVIGDATLYCGSMEDVLPTLGRFDACVTDPPYGIGEAAGKNKSRGPLARRDYGNATVGTTTASPAAMQPDARVQSLASSSVATTTNCRRPRAGSSGTS
jgi:tRNA G10  N-methylase Trm11